jgi:tRNA A37 threonylcarbamoyladenosine dehydratase
MGHARLVKADPKADYPSFLADVGEVEKSTVSRHPVVISMRQPKSRELLEQLVRAQTIHGIVDNYAEQYAELLLSRNAHLYRANYDVQVASIASLLKEHYGTKQPWQMGSWVYYPWSKQLVHILDQDLFEDLRSIRNRDLITDDEQRKLAVFEVACFGMSVGSAGALALAITGISRRIKLIDGAVISGSNLNRILTGVTSVGQAKSAVIGQNIYEMNPYATVVYHDTVNAKNIADILENPWPVHAVVDEIDDIEMKVRLRVEARQRRIPVLMATEIGDTIILDVERYDLEPTRALFHGIVPNIDKLIEEELENHREWMKHAVNIIGPKNMHIKMQESLLKIGTTIVTHPQLGSTVMMTGGVLAFAVKSLALGSPLKSGRYVISLEKQLLTDHRTLGYKRRHRKHTKVIRRAIGSM